MPPRSILTATERENLLGWPEGVYHAALSRGLSESRGCGLAN